MTDEAILKTVELISNKLGVAASSLVEAFARQVFREGLVELIIFLVSILVGAFMIRVAVSIQDNINNYHEERLKEEESYRTALTSYDYISTKRDQLREKISTAKDSRTWALFLAGIFFTISLFMGPSALYDLLGDPKAMGVMKLLKALRG